MTGVNMNAEYQHVIDIMGFKPVNEKGEYSSADIAEVNVILHEIDEAILEVFKKHGVEVNV